MTEVEWMVCKEPRLLLRHLRQLMDGDMWRTWIYNPERTPRKWRLFACACCYRIWRWLDRGAREMVLWSECIAEQKYTKAEWDILVKAFRAKSSRIRCEHHAANAAIATFAGGAMVPDGAGRSRRVRAHKLAAKFIGQRKQSVRREELDVEAAHQCALIRDIFGNPFCPFPPLAPAVVAWNNDTVRRVAQAIYDERTFDCLSNLADTLELAGCTNAEILKHCREPGSHVKGCWVVDLILNKE